MAGVLKTSSFFSLRGVQRTDVKGKRENHISNKELASYSANLKLFIEPTVSSLSFTMLDVSLVKEFETIYLRVTIEHPDHIITLSDCELVSREVEKELDKKDLIPFNYNLEVQSKGTDSNPQEAKYEFVLDKLGLVVKS